MDMKLVQKIQGIGLSENEALVYTTLLERGGASPSFIADETRLNRTTVYRILDSLLIKGLVNSVLRAKKQFYQAENSHALERYAKDRVTIAERAKQQTEQLSPMIDSLLRMASHKPLVEFYEGPEGVQDMYADHVRVSAPYEMLGFANISNLHQFFGETFFQNYVQKKLEIGISTRGILPDTKQDETFIQEHYARAPKQLVPHIRTVAPDIFPYQSEITIYGINKVSIVNIYDSQIIGMRIEDQMTHDMMTMIFELAWQGAK
jgi:sugar-specific transcriptional regulator TrmB